MRMYVPYEKEVVFNTKIAEISSISLEYEANVLNDEIAGDFILTGEYKIHEVSVNKEPFKYRLPFSITLSDRMIRDSIKYDINNFTYDVVGDDTLKVNIEFLVDADEIEELEQEDANLEEKDDNVNRELDEVDELIDKRNIAIDTKIDEILNNMKIDEEVKDKMNEVIENNEIKKEEIKESKLKEDIVLNNVSNTVDTYVTYHIHVLEDMETIDAIATKFNVSKELLEDYNNGIEWIVGEKVLIPELNNE